MKKVMGIVENIEMEDTKQIENDSIKEKIQIYKVFYTDKII